MIVLLNILLIRFFHTLTKVDGLKYHGKKFSISIQPSGFLKLGCRITNRSANARCYATELHHFKAHFGTTPSNASLLWSKIQSQSLAPRASPIHLLWSLLWLKVYATETVLASYLGVDERSFRDRTKEMVKTIAKLKPLYVS